MDQQDDIRVVADDDDLDQLIVELGDDDTHVRLGAASILSELGEIALPRLIDALSSDNRYRRGESAAVISSAAEDHGFVDQRAVEPLQALLADESSDVIRAAAHALRWLGHWPAIPAALSESAYTANVYASHHQFYLGDSGFDATTKDLPFLSDDRARRLSSGLDHDIIHVFTSRYGTVPLAIERRDQAPTDDLNDWDHVEDISLSVTSNGVKLVELFQEDGPRDPDYAVPAGAYRVRVYMGNLDGGVYSGEDDYYHIVLWPAPLDEPRVLRAYQGG